MPLLSEKEVWHASKERKVERKRERNDRKRKRKKAF